MRSRTLALLPAALLLLAPACADSPAAPAPDAPAYSFMNGPLELPNLYRFEATWLFWMRDPESGLVAVANLPANVADWRPCGGTEALDPVPMQHVNSGENVWHMLTLDGDANLHVFRNADIADFRSFCTAPLLASGKGRFMNTDNDLLASGTRANVWSYHLTGTVEMTDGSGAARLNAFANFRNNPSDASYVMLNRWIRLH